MKKAAKEKVARSILDMLLAYGIGGTLDYLCTFSAFSVLSVD